MTPQQKMTKGGEAVGCPNMARMKRWYWSLSQHHIPENFLFLACCYYLALEMQRTMPSEERVKFLIGSFALNRSSPLYLNLSSHVRQKAESMIRSGNYNQTAGINLLGDSADEISFIVQGKLAEGGKTSLRNMMTYYNNPTKLVPTHKWQQIFFGAKPKVRISTKVKKVDSDAIDLVIDNWGNAPWLSQLRAMS